MAPEMRQKGGTFVVEKKKKRIECGKKRPTIEAQKGTWTNLLHLPPIENEYPALNAQKKSAKIRNAIFHAFTKLKMQN